MNRKLEECASQIDSSIFGSAVYTAADLVCQAEQKACKGFSYCYNSVQQKIPDKDLSRILKGVGLIAVGAGKVTGAVALAAISAPFCGAVVGVAGEAAAGITAAAGGGDIAQGLQEIMCGWNGDSESESYNLVRDTLYSGNETAYQISTGTAAVCGGAGKWLDTRAAKAAEAAAKKAAEEAAGLADETAEAAAKTAAKEAGEAAEEAVKQSTKDALEDAAGETAIGNLDGIEGIGKSGTATINPNDIRFSQSSVNGASEIIDSMKAKGWDGDPIDVVRMPDGNLTTIDNTRVLAARYAEIDVQANVHAFDEVLPQDLDLIERLTTPKGVPQTWGDAVLLRIGKQNSGYRNTYPLGSNIIGWSGN